MRIGLLLFLPLLLLFSCISQEICDDIIQSDAVVRFKIIDSDPIADTLISGLSVFGIRNGLSDSLLYDSTTTSMILLPLDPHHDNSRFVFQVNGKSDTLNILHNNESYLISYSCGFAKIFTLESVNHSNWMLLDNEIINSLIDAELEQNEEHLWIYF